MLPRDGFLLRRPVARPLKGFPAAVLQYRRENTMLETTPLMSTLAAKTCGHAYNFQVGNAMKHIDGECTKAWPWSREVGQGEEPPDLYSREGKGSLEPLTVE